MRGLGDFMAVSRKRKKHQPAARQYSTVSEHKQQGKKLLPPFKQLKNFQSASWLDSRLPEMLWCVLLRGVLNQDEFVVLIRDLAPMFRGLADGDLKFDPTLSGLTVLPEGVWDSLRGRLSCDSRLRRALRPLLLFGDLPGREKWKEIVRDEPTLQDWGLLRNSVLAAIFHQSQEATDCRWARIVCMVLAGKIRFVGEELRETAKGVLGYPDYGDQRRVRPSVRALEVTFSGEDGALSPVWCESFWKQCFERTPCGVGIPFQGDGDHPASPVAEEIQYISVQLAQHCEIQRNSTSLDPRLDAVYGLAAYALVVIGELFRGECNTGVLGRLGLRTILECLITLKYLSTVNSPEVWMAYRTYGSGQVKLAFLKHLEATEDGSTSLDPVILEQLANEDVWMEFLDINLADWEGKNLRQRAQESATKEDYDAYYSWNSGFSHGNWGAIRTTIMETCSNPLHRFHRILRTNPVDLPDVRQDACVLMDKILEVVNSQYPGFHPRLLRSD